MKTHYYQAASFAALLCASQLVCAEVSSPHADALRAAGYQVHNGNDGGFKVDFGTVKVINDASIAHIAALGDVRELSGTGEGVNDAVFAKMIKAVPALETLFINSSMVTDDGSKVLASLPKFRHLGLHHGCKEFTGKGLLALKDNPNFKSVEFGGMGSIDDASVRYFAEMPHLREIAVFHTMNTRASLPVLVKKNPLLEKFAFNPHFQPARFVAQDIALLAPLANLNDLTLSDMVLPFENGLSHLTALKGLKKVSLEWSIYTDEDLAKLKAILPNLEIITSNRGKMEELTNWNERLEAMKKDGLKK